MNFRIIAGISLLILFGSCKNDINPDEILSTETNFNLIISGDNNSTLDNQINKTITIDSGTIEKLRYWFAKNSNGWKSSFASWATPDISVIGTDFLFLIYKDGVVLGFTDKKGKSIQLVKKVNIAEFSFLIK